MSQKLLAKIYNRFDPFRPLPAGDVAYVDLQSVRGDDDILLDLGQQIYLSRDTNTCQLYTGHRGAGKSTELLKLREDLRSKGYYVVYFAADVDDIEPEDTEYTDILLACTRHVLEDLKQNTDPAPLLNWLKSRWESLKELALSDVEFDSLKIEAQIAQFAKMTTNIRKVPRIRQQLRDRLDAYTPSLVDALNEFINEAKQKLPAPCKDIVIIVDNLDRIAFIKHEQDKSSNYEEIFINRGQQLRNLNCHLIYTVPISMVFSDKAPNMEDIYDDRASVLPMIMVRQPDYTVHRAGVDKLKEIIAKRIVQVAPELAQAMDAKLFDDAETLEQLCLMSGGHPRNLMQFIRRALGRTTSLPIGERAVKRAISETRDTYRNAIKPNQWQILAQVANSKSKPNDDDHGELLLNRAILEYCYADDEGEIQRWFDVHPVIRGIKEFQAALSALEQP